VRRTKLLAAVAAVLLLTSGTVGVVAGTALAGATPGESSVDASAGALAETATDPAPRPQASGVIRGSPELSVVTARPEVTPGRTNEVTLQVVNDGDVDLGTPQTREVVTTARNVRLTAEAGNTPLTVETGTVALGSVTETAPREVPIAVSVPNGTEAGSYEIDVELEYAYTYQQSGGVTYDRQETVTAEVDLEVTEDARFRIVNVTTNAQVGDRGTLEAEVRNVGATTAHDATVALESSSAGLALGQGTSDAALVESIAPGETVTVPYDASFTPTAPVRQYAVSGRVTFESPDGIPHVDEGLSAGVAPLGEQTFAVADVASTLRVGEDGELTGTVTNTGPAAASSVVVQYAGESANVIPVERSAAVGALDSGESAEFALPISIGGEAESGLRSLDLAVQYRNDDGEARGYDELAVGAEVAPERDRFTVAVENRTIEAGGTRTVEVAVTNNLEETASDIEGRLFADDPLDTGTTDTGYVQSLGPGETTTMTFELTTTGAATPESIYPISLDFRYDDADGDSQLTDTYRVPIEVTESEGGGLPIPVIVIGLLAIATAGLVAYRRRQ
jgi:sialidase-1